MNKVIVRVPATTANMGPGFDCIGMALDLWNEVEVSYGPFSIEITGEGAGTVPADTRNLVVTGSAAAFEEANIPMPSLVYRCLHRIPIGKGLGSSSADIVGGFFAGAALAGIQLDPHRMMKIAADIEGHPDNVAPAVFGGLTVGVHDGDEWAVCSSKLPNNLRCVLFIPDTETNTHESRARLPKSISRADAVYNIGRSAMLIASLYSGDLSMLKYATQDKMHQPYRAAGFKAMDFIMKAAMNGGAKGVFLSGSGPTIIALSDSREITILYEMNEAARVARVPGRSMIIMPSARGAHLVEA